MGSIEHDVSDHSVPQQDSYESTIPDLAVDAAPCSDIPDVADLLEAHAAARWARAVVRLIDSPRDPRTLAGWGRWVAVSPGALRNWCRTAGIQARRSLVFGRMLRAVYLSQGGRHKPENLLDVVDRRTLVGLLKYAGLGTDQEFPGSIQEFLERQTLVLEPDALTETRRLLGERRLGRPSWSTATE